MREDKQAIETERRNAEYFVDNDRYVQAVSTLETYRQIRESINTEVRGAGRVLDVGNGGVFDYDTSLADEVVALDLFLSPEMPALPAHVSARQGNVLALDDDLRGFNLVLFVMLLHHLTGDHASDTYVLIRRAIEGAKAALVPGGRLVVVESCVPRWFTQFERVAFPLLKRACENRWISHPPTFQLTAGDLTGLVLEDFYVEKIERIKTGPVLLQFGRRWPTLLSPARPLKIVGIKR